MPTYQVTDTVVYTVEATSKDDALGRVLYSPDPAREFDGALVKREAKEQTP